MKLSHLWLLLLVLAFGSLLPMRAVAQDDLEQRVSRLVHRVASDGKRVVEAVKCGVARTAVGCCGAQASDFSINCYHFRKNDGLK